MTRLILVTLLLAAVALVVRVKSGKAPKSERLRVTARTALHRNAAVVVVEVDGRRLLVGTSAQHVSLLTELDPVPAEPAPRHRPERPSELPSVPAEAPTLLERARRATSRTLDPAQRSRRRADRAAARLDDDADDDLDPSPRPTEELVT